MGGRARVSVDDGSTPILDRLVEETSRLESLWSRFIEDSEVSRLNACDGAPAFVSAETAQLIDAARRAHRATQGFFDPLMLRELAAAGYAQTFDLVAAGRPPLPAHEPSGIEVRPSIQDADVDTTAGLVQLPAGAAFDPGGIGKGLATDRLAALAVDSGADWAIVDLGGDVRVRGDQLPFGEFRIDIAHPDGSLLGAVGIADGAAATSGTGKRRWRRADGIQQHHLLDPRTGEPAVSDLAAVTVLASEAWWAEAVATAAVVAGRDRGVALLEELDVPAIAVTTLGHTIECGPIEEFLL